MKNEVNFFGRFLKRFNKRQEEINNKVKVITAGLQHLIISLAFSVKKEVFFFSRFWSSTYLWNKEKQQNSRETTTFQRNNKISEKQQNSRHLLRELPLGAALLLLLWVLMKNSAPDCSEIKK